ncbi:hypothetical protein FWK35_00035290 [Aphis craccivora]|uniref:Uncharacterized protein n=1 Tax=Aphis craccivora TaxID=307492 RepID=A0A6G0VMZ0_APHCR|nr:hypothetical protein FWK35_00035290 [Aphis craccivora]
MYFKAKIYNFYIPERWEKKNLEPINLILIHPLYYNWLVDQQRKNLKIVAPKSKEILNNTQPLQPTH